MAIRVEVNNVTLRLFGDRREAEIFAENLSRSEGVWCHPIYFQCGWVVSKNDEVLYDNAGRVPDEISELILKGSG